MVIVPPVEFCRLNSSVPELYVPPVIALPVTPLITTEVPLEFSIVISSDSWLNVPPVTALESPPDAVIPVIDNVPPVEL